VRSPDLGGSAAHGLQDLPEVQTAPAVDVPELVEADGVPVRLAGPGTAEIAGLLQIGDDRLHGVVCVTGRGGHLGGLRMRIGAAGSSTHTRITRRAMTPQAAFDDVEYRFDLGFDGAASNLRRVRLDRTRDDLRDATPADGVAVTKIADRWGFAKPGRFAELCRAAYGETPNQTLRG